MKTINSIILFCLCWNLQAQNNEDLLSANKEIYLLTDSLWNLEKQFINRSIDEKTYLKISGELLNAISALAYSNASNYTRQIEEMEAQDGSPQVVDLPTPPTRDPQDTLPAENNMEQMPDFNPPGNPMSMITGSGRRTSFKLRYGMFWNGLSQGTKNESIEYPKFKLWNSYCWFSEFDILLQTRLGKSNRGPFSIYYGIGWDIRQYTQKENPQQLTLNQEKAVFFKPVDKLDKASLNVSYFRFPIGLQYKKKKLAVNVGGYIGLLTNHEQVLESKTSLGEESELTLDKNYNLTKTNYGLSASLGYKHIHLAFNYDLNTLFKDNEDYKYNGWKIGLMIF